MFVETLAKETVAPIMSSAGFRKKRFTWNRNRAGFIDVVNIQRDKIPHKDMDVFTMNIGIFVPEFFQIIWGKPKNSYAIEADCPIDMRIGTFFRDDLDESLSYDKWWEVESERTLSERTLIEASIEIAHILQQRVIPFFERFNTIQDIHDFMKGYSGGLKEFPLYKLYFAIAKYYINDIEGCRKIVEECRKTTWKPRADIVYEALKL